MSGTSEMAASRRSGVLAAGCQSSGPGAEDYNVREKDAWMVITVIVRYF
jgi:hypothetical protein